MNILITCPPMICQIKSFDNTFKENNIIYHIPEFTALMSEAELINIIDRFDGWIAGDDPVSENVLKKGYQHKLKIVVKWGIGTDNVDYSACKKYGIKIFNTPGVFNEEVSDIAVNYLLTLSRKTHIINQKVRQGIWYKPSGMSLSNKKVCLIGFGNIGQAIARKLLSFNLNLHVFDPGFFRSNDIIYSQREQQPVDSIFQDNPLIHISQKIDFSVEDANFIIACCSLNENTYHLINKDLILKAASKVIIINVSRGGVLKESDVVELLTTGYIDSVGLDVFETEPLNTDNPLLQFEQNIYGSHNSSNTVEGVIKASNRAIHFLLEHMNSNKYLCF